MRKLFEEGGPGPSDLGDTILRKGAGTRAQSGVSHNTESRPHLQWRWATHRPRGAVMAAAVGLCIASACSREGVHRVLVFLYDGVPPLVGEVVESDTAGPEVPTAEPVAQSVIAVVPTKTLYLHTPFRENRCDGCHVASGGKLIKTVREGLCWECHPDKPPKMKYTHGPVAVNRCMACHINHKSRYPNTLKTDVRTICLECHVQANLSNDQHHATLEEERCIDCHNAHGGNEPFFLTARGIAIRDSAP